ncbi:uncharacterized protein LOC113497634 isoform X3 [Trichoplusia ni]|uniref:Uncharacterized protein LOC113497634 isoform X3 n=1 Tax=Trichoplusia ni TaxID=7111 RepID=A0A7E5VXH5_TRINI|nr:uncharacterized protein LOC113497634 isoform X3 [Trichoplusia ni]
MSKQYKKVLCSGITWSTLFILLFAVNIVASTPKFEMVEELRTSVVKNLLFVTSFFKLVRIEKLVVPELVDIISNDVILDCQFTTVDDNFTLQWIFNDGVTPVYEWTPYSEPKVAGILDERLDLTYRVSRFSRDERRALRITNLTSELSGEYTCIVSNHGTEVRKTKAMLIYSVERDFQLTAENRPNSTVIFLTCTARGVYPRPDLTLEYNKRKPKLHFELQDDCHVCVNFFAIFNYLENQWRMLVYVTFTLNSIIGALRRLIKL